MTSVKLQSGIRPPVRTYQSYPWQDMKVGQSFFMPGKAGSNARLAAYAWARRHPPTQFQTQGTEEAGQRGVRIWRTT